MTRIQNTSTKYQSNSKFEIPMSETKSLDSLISRFCFEFVILVIGYYPSTLLRVVSVSNHLLFGICNLCFLGIRVRKLLIIDEPINLIK
jgi:hypothetical protein